MSVISVNRRPARHWAQLWPLALFLLAAAVGLLWLWQAWPGSAK